ncbi:MAG TPA: hypothetical protein VMX16_02110 [Terriglobia bacterium]|nr:hypothetical protein [Terriglobia bacterium]
MEAKPRLSVISAVLVIGVIMPGLSPALRASNTSGSGTSVLACSGFMPNPCARQDMAPQQVIELPAPAVGVPIVLPGSGERLVRVTDQNYYSPAQSPPQSFGIPENGPFSLYDSSIPGYWVIAKNAGSGLYLSKMTYPGLQLTRVWPSTSTDSSQLVPLDAVFNFSSVSPGLAFGTATGYGGSSDQIYAYSFPGEPSAWTGGTSDTKTTIFNAATSMQGLTTGCATTASNFPGFVGGYGGGASTGGSDSEVLIYAGGSSQDHAHLVLVGTNIGTQAAPSWKCDWIDTSSMAVAGYDYAGVQPTGWVFPAPTSVSAVAGTGTLGVATTNVTVSIVSFDPSKFGGSDITFPETTTPATIQVTTGSSQGIVFTRPSLVTSGLGFEQTAFYTAVGTSSVPFEWGIYACAAPCTTPTLQAYVPWATTTYTLNSIVAGTALPATNYAGFYLHGANLTQDGKYVRISTATDAQQVQALVFWQIGTTTITACTGFDNSDHADLGTYCGGHPGPSATSLLNAYSVSPFTDLGTFVRPYSNLTANVQLSTNPPVPQYFDQDSHYGNSSIANYPATMIHYVANYHANSDGTQNATNPVSSTTVRALTNETDDLSLTTPNTWWRFGHPRSACLNNNTIGQSITEIAAYEMCPQPGASPDGRLIGFNSNWDWMLGTSNGNWKGSTSYSAYNVEQTATNSNFWELALNSGTSGASPPATWNTGMGQITTDNNITWETIPGCPAGTSFPMWTSGQGIALNYVIQSPLYNFEQVTTTGTTLSMPATPPAWPEWTITSSSVTGGTETLVLSGAAAIPAVNDSVVVWSVTNPGTTNTQALDGTFKVNGSNSSTSTITVPNGAGAETGTGGIVIANSAGAKMQATDANGNVWTMTAAANVNGTYKEGPKIGNNVARSQCREDLFLVETK